MVDTTVDATKDDLQQNLVRIRELTETVVPFVKTIGEGATLLDARGNKKAVMIPIHKEKDYAILVVEVEGGFVHKSHFHNEYEILCLLEGEVIIKFPDKEVELKLHEPVFVDKHIPHEVYYMKDTRLLTITIPASDSFPNPKKEIS